MGVVYEALDRERKARVALKTLPFADPAALYRFKCEFREIADVAHPNLVAIHDLVADGEPIFFTMELLAGVDFLRHVRSSPALESAPTSAAWAVGAPTVDAVAPGGSEPSTSASTSSAAGVASGPRLGDDEVGRLLAAMAQLAQGVLALHDAGKLHRDLKPGNVMVTPEGRVVVLDFGLVADVQRGVTQQHLISGTAEYMSPEQAAGQPLTEATDWYSVGVMLYEALTGRLPYVGAPLSILMEKQRADPTSPRVLLGGEGAVSTDVAMLCALCGELLARSPERRPSGREVLRRLLVGAVESSPMAAAPPISQPTAAEAFIGREHHIVALAEAYRRVREGRPVSVFVHGSSGMGKSLLVRRFLDELEAGPDARDTVLLVSRCYERESIPYKALDSLIDALTRYLLSLPERAAIALLPLDIQALARVFPVLRRIEALHAVGARRAETADPQELRRRAFVALRELFLRLCAQSTLVVWIDDLQWGDVDSIAILGELLRPPEPPAMLLVATYRTEDRASSPALIALSQTRAHLRDDIDAREIVVGELGLVESGRLAAMMLGTHGEESRRQAEAIAAEAGGSPFFVGVLVRHAQSALALRASPGGHVPRLAEVLMNSFDALADVERRLLEVVAVAGHPLTREVALQAADVPAHRGGAAFAALRAGQLVRTTRVGRVDQIEAFHDRIRETLVDSLSTAAVAAYHKRIALALQGAGRGQAEALAVHFREAGEREAAATWAVTAGEEAAAALAFHRAATWFRTALELGVFEVEAARALRVKRAEALADAGRGAEAAREFLAALGGAAPAASLELRRNAAAQLFTAGHFDAALAEMRVVLAGVGVGYPEARWRVWLLLVWSVLRLRLRGLDARPRPSSARRARALAQADACFALANGLALVDHVLAHYFATRALLLALDAGDPARTARSLAGEIAARALGGAGTEAKTEPLARAVLARPEVAASAYLTGVALGAAGLAAFQQGRWRRALELLDECATQLRRDRTGAGSEVANAHFIPLEQLYLMGDLAELARRTPALIKDARERGDLFIVTNARIGRPNSIWLAADDPTRARHEVDEAMRAWPATAIGAQHYFACLSRAQIDLYVGRGARALVDLRAQWAGFRGALLFMAQHIRVDALHLRARCALAAASEATEDAARGRLVRAAERDARRLDREAAPWAKALARLLHAGVASSRGDARGAIRLLVDAAAELDACDMALFAIVARRRQGELTGGEAGHALMRAADAEMTARTIKNPARMCDVFAPGFGARGDAVAKAPAEA